jgi:hypothetical protein
MRVVRLTATAGSDGHIRLDIPATAGEYEVAVVLSPKVGANGAGRKPTPEELGWPAGYFGRTFGAIPDFSVAPREVEAPDVREEF